MPKQEKLLYVEAQSQSYKFDDSKMDSQENLKIAKRKERPVSHTFSFIEEEPEQKSGHSSQKDH